MVVDDSLKASLNFNVSLSERLATAQVWTRILINLIPENRLQACFDHALKTHKSNFPVNAYDLKNAWTETEKLEFEKKEAAEALNKVKHPTAFCPNSTQHFEGELNGEKIETSDGLVMMANGFNEPEIPVPCYQCRQSAYAQFLQRRKFKPMIEIINKKIALVRETEFVS